MVTCKTILGLSFHVKVRKLKTSQFQVMMQIREGCVEQKLTTSDKTCHLKSKCKVKSRNAHESMDI